MLSPHRIGAFTAPPRIRRGRIDRDRAFGTAGQPANKWAGRSDFKQETARDLVGFQTSVCLGGLCQR
jgi:hypothetical protein